MENMGEEVNQAKKVDSNKQSNITKIIVGVIILVAIICIAVFAFWFAFANKVVDGSKDSIDSIVNLGQSLVDSALDDSSNLSGQIKENINNANSAIINDNQADTKKSISADEFYSKMQAKGYEVIDTTASFADQGDYVKKSYLAKKTGYQIEFYELSSEAVAISAYNNNKAKCESQKGNTSSYSTISKNNYNTYTLTTNGKYKYIARVDNTDLYLDVDVAYMDEVKSVVTELGY